MDAVNVYAVSNTTVGSFMKDSYLAKDLYWSFKSTFLLDNTCAVEDSKIIIVAKIQSISCVSK